MYSASCKSRTCALCRIWPMPCFLILLNPASQLAAFEGSELFAGSERSGSRLDTIINEKEVNIMKEYKKTVLVKFETAEVSIGNYRMKGKCGSGGC